MQRSYTSHQGQEGPQARTVAGNGLLPFRGIAASNTPGSTKARKMRIPSYVDATRTRTKWPSFHCSKVAVSGRGVAVPTVLGVIACCFLVELICAAAAYCGVVPAAITPSAWLIVYPTLGLAFICVVCVAWMRRRRNTSVRYADAVLSKKPSDNILTLKAVSVILFVIWGLCLVASLPSWEKWVGVADTIVCCLPVAVLLLLLFGFFFEEAYPQCEMWTMPADPLPTQDSATSLQADNAGCGVLPPKVNMELATPTVHSVEETGECASGWIHTLSFMKGIC